MKKLLISMAVVAAAAFGVYTANKDNATAQMSDLQQENLEILAEGESAGPCCTRSTQGTWCLVFSGYDLIFQQSSYACSSSCTLRCHTGY